MGGLPEVTNFGTKGGGNFTTGDVGMVTDNSENNKGLGMFNLQLDCYPLL